MRGSGVGGLRVAGIARAGLLVGCVGGRCGLRRSLPALLLGAVGLVLAACASADGGEPRPVTLAELVAEQDRHDGTRVVVRGTVNTFDDPRHYWIEDVEQHRVELVPEEVAEDLVGAQVEVVGRFSFRDDQGRVIEVEDLEVVDGGPSALAAANGANLHRYPGGVE